MENCPRDPKELLQQSPRIRVKRWRKVVHSEAATYVLITSSTKPKGAAAEHLSVRWVGNEGKIKKTCCLKTCLKRGCTKNKKPVWERGKAASHQSVMLHEVKGLNWTHFPKRKAGKLMKIYTEIRALQRRRWWEKDGEQCWSMEQRERIKEQWG